MTFDVRFLKHFEKHNERNLFYKINSLIFDQAVVHYLCKESQFGGTVAGVCREEWNHAKAHSAQQIKCINGGRKAPLQALQRWQNVGSCRFVITGGWVDDVNAASIG